MTEKEMVDCPYCHGTGNEPFFQGMLCGRCINGKVSVYKKFCTLCSHPLDYHDGGYCSHGLGGKKKHKYECSSESSSGQFICGCNPEEPFSLSAWARNEEEKLKKQLKEQGVMSFFKTALELEKKK